MTHTPGPWVAETSVCKDETGDGLAVIAVRTDVPEGCTPTRGMVAWVHSGLGACSTDDEAIATARLIAAAPDLLAALKGILHIADRKAAEFDAAHAAIAKAEGAESHG